MKLHVPLIKKPLKRRGTEEAEGRKNLPQMIRIKELPEAPELPKIAESERTEAFRWLH